MKRTLIFCLVAVLILLVFTSCGGKKINETTNGDFQTDPTTAPATDPVTDPVTDSGTDPVTEGEIEIMWVLQRGIIREKVPYGTVPTPPSDYDETVTGSTHIFTFTGWDKEITVATQKTTYIAQYDTAFRFYEVLVTLDGETKDYPTRFDEIPDLPTASEGKVILWNRTIDKVIGDTTYYGWTIDNNRDDMEYLEWAFKQPDMYYAVEKRSVDLEGGGLYSASALYYLIYLQRNDPTVPSAVLDRIEMHFKKVLGGGGYEPRFECCCNWNYPVLISCFTLAKKTPSIWNRIGVDLQERMDFMMKCFTVTCAFGTDDDNNYSTGVNFIGNYSKGWNPNYRLANIPNILLAVPYFGTSEAVNDILLDFDFDTYIAQFEKYNYTSALAAWTREAFENENGILVTTAKEVMMNGGTAYFYDMLERNGQKIGGEAGTGAGVRTTYSYSGYTLDEIPEIINSLLTFNYGGGNVFSSYSAGGTKLAYILDDSVSPVEGKNGMMLEFNSGDGGGKRVSASYCEHDLIMIVFLLRTFEELGIYNIEDYYDIFDLAYVGNTDLIYKLEKGFMSYSLGSSYETRETWDEGYMIAKYFWNNLFAPRYEVKTEKKDNTFTSVAASAGTSTVLVPGTSGGALKYDMSSGYTYLDTSKRLYSSSDYVIWDMEFLAGKTAYNAVFYLRDGGANKKSPLMSFSVVDGVPTFAVASSTLAVSDGWHRVTFVVRQTNSGSTVSITSSAYIDGVFFADYTFKPVQNDLFYNVDSSGNPQMTAANTYFYIYMAGNAVEGYLSLRNIQAGYGTSSTESMPVLSAPVSYVLNGASFIENGSYTRKTIGLSTQTLSAYTHTFVDVNNYYQIGTLAGDQFTPRAVFSAPSATRMVNDGYGFAGWYTDASFETPYTREALNGEPLTLYAKWIPTGGTLTFNPVGGEFSADTVLQRKYNMGDPSVTLPVPAKQYARFIGWYTDETYAGECYNGTYVLNPEQYGSISFFAKWEPTAALIHYEGVENGKLLGTYSDHFDFGTTQISLPSGIEREGYVFTGWYLSSDYTQASKVSGYTYAIPADWKTDLTFYAEFTKTGTEITYVCEGELIGDYNKMIPIGSAFTIKLPQIKLAGYELDAWYKSSDYSGTGYTDTYELPVSEAVSSGITFYAKLKSVSPIDSIHGSQPTILAKSEKISFSSDGTTSRVTFEMNAKSDAYIIFDGMTNRIGIYELTFKLSKPTEESSVPSFTIRVHSPLGSAGSSPRRSEVHLFTVSTDGTMALLGQNVGTVSTTAQEITIRFDFASELGKVHASCSVNGGEAVNGSSNSDIYAYDKAVELFGATEVQDYHTPGLFYIYFGGSVGTIYLDDFVCKETY